MPPRRTPRKKPSANEPDVDSGHVSATNIPKRAVCTSCIHQNSITLGNGNPSFDELDTPVETRDTEQAKAKAEEEVMPDEIVVSDTTQDTNIKRAGPDSQYAALETPVEGSRGLRRSSRAASTSQNGSSTLSPSSSGITVKKQDLLVETAAEDDGKPEELSDAPASKKRKVDPKPTKRIAIRKSRSKWDNHDEMLTDPNSPLVKAKLRVRCST